MKNTEINGLYNLQHTSVRVKIERGRSRQLEYTFSDSFTIGRAEECSIQLDEKSVSRCHLEIIYDDGIWIIADKGSTNGTFLNGNKIDHLEIKNSASVELGKNGPILLFTLVYKEEPLVTSNQAEPSVTSYIRKYFEEEKDEQNIGQHTRMIRLAFETVQRKNKRKYIKSIVLLSIITLAGLSYSVYQYLREHKQITLAENIFYLMKAQELEISNLKDSMININDPKILLRVKKTDEDHQKLKQEYDKLVEALGVYDLNDEDKLIVRMARIFGECEFDMPKSFINEVKNYINKWKSSSRMVRALDRAKINGYIKPIIRSMSNYQLAPQFIFLALQESDFNDKAIGPITRRYGCAKGMWQFIAKTAKAYGLKTGTSDSLDIYDPVDERFNFSKATEAAAKYIKYIYNTDAQASGLLVIASYNWGEKNILPLIRTMPQNPRERNFWKVLERYRDKIPDETYKYVFYIFSAAVICENPRLFGFNFDNPLKNPMQNFLQ